MNTRICLVLVLALLVIPPVQAQEVGSSDAGTSVANYLKLPVGARSAAMGGAYVGMDGDVSALYWNPGAVATVPGSQAMFHTTDWLVDTRTLFAAVAIDVGDLGIVGISLNSFDGGEMEETTIEQPDGTGRNFSVGNLSLGLTYARQITDRFSAGITLKYVNERLDRTRANAFAADVGSIFVTDFFGNMRIGFALSNLGGRMSFDGSDLLFQHQPDGSSKFVPAYVATDPWELPLLFRFGLASDVVQTANTRLTLSGEVYDARDSEARVHAGGEWAYSDLLFLRGGYRFGYDEAGLTLGAGLQTPDWFGSRLRFDYAYEHHTVFDAVQSFTLSLTI